MPASTPDPATGCDNGSVPLTIDEIRAAPKVLLHDHLDGGLRAATVVDLARQIGYDRLPSEDPGEVQLWLQRGANRGHLNLYLDAFQHTVAVMQTRPGDVLVVDAGGCVEAGFIGDILVAGFMARGGAGILCDCPPIDTTA